MHIPYRNHKLTMLMSDSLGGTAKTLMFVNVSPTDANLDETHGSLEVRRFGTTPPPPFLWVGKRIKKHGDLHSLHLDRLLCMR